MNRRMGSFWTLRAGFVVAAAALVAVSCNKQPAAPANAPPRITCAYRTRDTAIPAASAVAGDSPTARTASPGRVRTRYHATSAVTATVA